MLFALASSIMAIEQIIYLSIYLAIQLKEHITSEEKLAEIED